MPTEMMPPIKCQHRWRSGPTFPCPTVPTATVPLDGSADQWEALDIALETGVCKRCGGARIRMFSRAREHFCSSWSYAQSMAELVLGRPLTEGEEERLLEKIGLN